MRKSILVDLNVILDILLERPGCKASQAVLEMTSTGYNVFISGHIVTTFAYLLEHAKVPKKELKRNISWLLKSFTVIATTEDILNNALRSDISDYEDAVIEQAALAAKASVIITRNIKDFTQSTISSITPEMFIQGLS